MNYRQREYVVTLHRRTAHLAGIIANWRGGNDSWARHELAALQWTIRVIEEAEKHGVLEDAKLTVGVYQKKKVVAPA